MRVNIYAEEMTDRIEIIEKEVDGHKFTALRFYLYLPTTIRYHGTEEINGTIPVKEGSVSGDSWQETHYQVKGPFIHREGDDDSAAVTFWGKQDLRIMLRKALEMLDQHYDGRKPRGPMPGFYND